METIEERAAKRFPEKWRGYRTTGENWAEVDTHEDHRYGYKIGAKEERELIIQNVSNWLRNTPHHTQNGSQCYISEHFIEQLTKVIKGEQL